jgi:nucleoid-associated protein YgaU
MIVDQEPALRLPRRRRSLGRALTALALSAGIGWALVGSVGASVAPTAAATVVVRSGDTLWSIAAEHYTGGDIRDEVARILAANRLSSPVIQPGETLILPSA